MRLTPAIQSAVMRGRLRTGSTVRKAWVVAGRCAVVAASLCSAASCCVAQSPAVQEALQRGAEAMHAGNSSEAESAFRDAVRLAPELAETRVDLGLVLGREGKLDEAIASLREGLAIDPGARSGHMFLGIFLYQKNEPEEARRELQGELAQSPNNVEALVWLGRVDMAQGHPERAVASLDRAAELSPNDVNLLEMRGWAHNQVAKESFSRMAKLDPSSWQVHHVQAQLYADEGKHAEAIVEYTAALKLQPSDADLYEALGDEYRSSSQLEAAETAYRKGYELAPTNPVALYNLGSIRVERGEDATGVPMLLEVQKSYPHSAIAEYFLGRGLANLGKDDEAAGWLSRSATDGNGGEVSKRAYYELTRTYRRLKRPKDEQLALEKYNTIRTALEKQGAEQVEKWKKLGAAANSTTTP